jgi:hypothetical protein
MKHKIVVSFLTLTMLSAVGVVGLTATAAQAQSPSTEHVSKTGLDMGNCIASPCATINYAISKAPPGTVIKVAAGTYDQTVDISKPIDLKGAGASSTTIDGTGIDPSNNGYYGVVYVGTTGGLTTIQGFTITNPYPDAYTSGEPEAVALADESSTDSIDVVDNDIVEGTSDPNASTDFPIGIDTFLNSAQTVILDNTISGFFQGALLEDNGPATVESNVFTDLISNTAGPTTYPAEGLFFLSDAAGSLTGQNATSNTFENYSGYGVAMDAGYDNGNCSTTPCNGSITGSISSNQFALTAGTPGAAAIALSALDNGNALTVTVNNDKGYVTSPSVGISITATGGGDISYTESGTKIKEHAA